MRGGNDGPLSECSLVVEEHRSSTSAHEQAHVDHGLQIEET